MVLAVADPTAPPPVSAAPAAAADAAALAASRRFTRRWLRALIVLAMLLPVVLFAGLAGWLHEQEFEQARARLDRSARIAQEHALKLFETNEMLLQRMLDLLADSSEAELLSRAAVLHQSLQRMAGGLPQVQGLFVNGADGRNIASNRTYPPPRHIWYTDRAWYRFHTTPGSAPLFFSELLVSRTTGEPAFDMSRRRQRADGSFGGTVHVSLRPDYLTDFYKALAATDDGLRVAVIRADGRLLARWPGGVPQGGQVPASDDMMQQIAAGRVSGEGENLSPFDQERRLRSFRQLGSYPLYVVAAVDTAVVLADWRRRCTLLALFLFPASLGFAWAGWLALRRTEEEARSTERLDDERARRQRAELALLQSQKLEAMGRLTGGVAHDFNNLLMVVNSNLHLHRRLWPAAAASPQLAAIERAVGSGAKLTRQLLAFARKQALLPERTRLQERLPTLLELLRPVLGAAIQVDSSVAVDTGDIEVDAAELELALINLAVNAKDAMAAETSRSASGRLAISARNARPSELPPNLSGEHVVLEVADSGPGIDPAIAERVFEPFFTTKPLGQGTGLGLSQVAALCHSAGGAARIVSPPAGGAGVQLFFKRLPAAPALRPAAPTAIGELDCRLLLVEDNDAVAEATRAVLESMGCRVHRVADGTAALQRIETRRDDFDAVLSDIEMPGPLDGIALALRLMQMTSPLPVVLMTGYAVRLEQAVKCKLEVLPKPCSPPMLVEALSKAMARGASVSAGAA